jgi:hypothetical protein
MEDNSDKKINSLKNKLQNSIKNIEITVDPEKQLPSTTSFRVIKKGILRSLRVYTTLQVQFNSYVLSAINTIKDFISEFHKVAIQQNKRIEKLEITWKNDRKKIASQYLSDIDSLVQEKFSTLRKLISQKNTYEYKSLYFTQFVDYFYLFI